MPTHRTADIYRDYVVVHGLERRALLEMLRTRFGEEATVLYPGCFVHVTPSFYFQHVVYVDRSDFARSFFADEDGVRQLISAHRRYRQGPFVRFVAQDFTTNLPVAARSFDLVLALYAGGVSRACARYLKDGGVVVSNDHHGDAGEAAALPTLSLAAVITERRGKLQYIDRDLDGHLNQRSADYYVFRKARSEGSTRI